VSAAASALALQALPARADEVARDRFDTLVVDAGHGGEDTGARGARGVLEKDLVLDVARELAARLRGQGVRVVMTRETDVFVPLEQRTAIANDARGDLFVSIHANSAPDSEVRGTETFFASLDATDAAAAHLASRENDAFRRLRGPSAPGGDPLLALLGDLIANEHLRESDEFARLAQTQLERVDPARSRGVKQAPFVVLMGVQMPAALIEIGFLTHRGDERHLQSARGRGEVVGALAAAVAAFGERYDARRGVPVEAAR
jgi:N-acetylmuramoyl-L-alanine amidase